METETKTKKDTAEANVIRESIKSSFKSLDCFCLPFPIENGLKGMNFEATLRNLDQIDFNDLRSDFRNRINELCDSIKMNICPKSVCTVPLSALAFSKYIEVVVKQLNENERVSLVDSLALSIRYASEKALKDAIENYKRLMLEFLNQKPMPQRWEILDSKNLEIMESCYKILEINLNGSNDLTRPVLETFQNDICEYKGEGRNTRLAGGIFFKIRSKNTLLIKTFNKNLLNFLWKTDIVEKFFNGNQDPNIGKTFIMAYEKLKITYNNKSFHSIEPEMTESFNKWYKENDIANVMNSMMFLSEQVKDNLEKEQQIRKERADRERIQADFKNAISLQQANNRNLNDKIRLMEIKYANQINDLSKKLNNAETATQAAQQLAVAAQDQVNKIQNSGGGKRCAIS